MPEQPNPRTDRRPLHQRILVEEEKEAVAKPMFPVFVLTLIGVAVSPILGEWRFGRSIEVILIGGAAVIALERSGAHRAVRRTGIAIVAVGAALVGISPALQGQASDVVIMEVTTAMFAVLLAVTPVVVIGRLLLRPKITLDTVSAALAGYLQIGLLFAALYNFTSSGRELSVLRPAVRPSTGFKFQYFSFITMTTVGYGDLTPATAPGQSLAMIEAVTGQVFLVTIVAVVVGNIGRELPHRRLSREKAMDDAEAADDVVDDADADGS